MKDFCFFCKMCIVCLCVSKEVKSSFFFSCSCKYDVCRVFKTFGFSEGFGDWRLLKASGRHTQDNLHIVKGEIKEGGVKWR